MRFLLLIAIVVIAFFLSEFLGIALTDAPSDASSEQASESTEKEAKPVKTKQQTDKSESLSAVRGIMTLALRRDQIFVDDKAVTMPRFRRMAEMASRDNILMEFVYDGTVTGSFVDEIKTVLRSTETKNAGLE